jgi:hypothetical protein
MSITKKCKTFLSLNKDLLSELKDIAQKLATFFIISSFLFFHITMIPSGEAFEVGYAGYVMAPIVLIGILYCIKNIFECFSSYRDSYKSEITTFLKLNICFAFVEIILSHAGNDIYRYILSNPKESIAVVVGAYISSYLYNMFSHNDTGYSHYEYFSNHGIAARKSVNLVINTGSNLHRTSKQEDMVAIHEVGHAIFHAGANIIPDTFEINIVGNKGSEGFVRTFADSNLDSSNDKIWSMYMLLGGYCAEKHFLGDHGFGCNSDLKKWESLAIRFLTHSEKVHYYSNPKTTLELENNVKLLKQLRKIQMNRIYKFFEKNKDVFMEIVTEIKNVKIMDKDNITPYLSKVEWDSSITRLNFKR